MERKAKLLKGRPEMERQKRKLQSSSKRYWGGEERNKVWGDGGRQERAVINVLPKLPGRKAFLSAAFQPRNKSTISNEMNRN